MSPVADRCWCRAILRREVPMRVDFVVDVIFRVRCAVEDCGSVQICSVSGTYRRGHSVPIPDLPVGWREVGGTTFCPHHLVWTVVEDSDGAVMKYDTDMGRSPFPANYGACLCPLCRRGTHVPGAPSGFCVSCADAGCTVAGPCRVGT